MTPLRKARLEIAAGVVPITFGSTVSLIGEIPPVAREIS
jgi:hypothetical protein